jgi:predicted DNA-binding transcriptional regulator AlpA
MSPKTDKESRKAERMAARLELMSSLPSDSLISVQELCEFLNRSKPSIYRDIKQGRIDPPIKFGSSSKFRMGYARSLTRGNA